MKSTLLAALLAVSAFAQTTTLSLSARNWSFTAYGGNLTKLSNNSSGDLVFTFPQSCPDPTTCTNPNTVNYLQTKYTKSLTGEHYVSVMLESTSISGTQWLYSWDNDGNNCNPGYPASAFIIVEQYRDNGGNTERWWANWPITSGDNGYSYNLEAGGILTINVPITPSAWADVNGQFGNTNVQGWTDAFKRPGLIGLTFGGGCFDGHGVDVLGGTATLSLISFQIY